MRSKYHLLSALSSLEDRCEMQSLKTYHGNTGLHKIFAGFTDEPYSRIYQHVGESHYRALHINKHMNTMGFHDSALCDKSEEPEMTNHYVTIFSAFSSLPI